MDTEEMLQRLWAGDERAFKCCMIQLWQKKSWMM